MPTPATVTSRMAAHHSPPASEIDPVRLHDHRAGHRQRVDEVDEVGDMAALEPVAAMADEGLDGEVPWIGEDDGGHDVGLARCTSPGRDPVDVDVGDAGELGDDPSDEALGDE